MTGRILFAFLLLLLAQPNISAATPTLSSSNDKEQIIENKVRIDVLEKKAELYDDQLEEKIEELEEKLELQKENLDFRNNSIDLWLTVLGIVLSFFGIAIPLAGFFFRQRLMDNFDKQENHLNSEIEKMKLESKKSIDEHIRGSEEEISKIVERLKKHEEDGLKYKDSLRLLAQDAVNQNKNTSTQEERNDLTQRAEIIVNAPDTSPFEKDMANLYKLHSIDKHQEVVDISKKILNSYVSEISLKQLTDVYFCLAHAYYRLDQFEESINNYQLIINLNQDTFGTWNNLGTIYGKVGDWKKAIQCYEKAIQLNPEGALAWANLAAIHMSEGNDKAAIEHYTEAVKLYEVAIELKPDTLNYPNLVEFNIILNNIEKAKRYLAEGQKKTIPDQTKQFAFLMLEKVISIVDGSFNQDIESCLDEVKQAILSPRSVYWSFYDLDQWLKSKTSNYLSKEQKDLIHNLMKVYEQWIKENKS